MVEGVSIRETSERSGRLETSCVHCWLNLPPNWTRTFKLRFVLDL